MHLGGRSGRRSLLSAKKKRRERGKNENEAKPNAFHNGLDAKIVAGDGKK
jgi:hypothetical protein